MFYFILIILVLVLFFMTRKDKKASDKYLSGALAAFTMAIVALVSYIARDAYYYNVVNNYFSLPKEIWKLLMFAPLPRNWIIRLMNISVGCTKQQKKQQKSGDISWTSVRIL